MLCPDGGAEGVALMTERRTPIPLAERTGDVAGDELRAVISAVSNERRIDVPVRSLCDSLGLDWLGQRQRLMCDEVLVREVRFVVMTPTHPEGGDPESLALPLEFLPGWRFGLDAARMKPVLKERIIRSRRECYRRLWDAFNMT
ncbi:MAG: hypothetical protein EOM24_15530 [Chloroflexia bacterium]|nr:hypothetical protein [Chloroflexia bacterium]